MPERFTFLYVVDIDTITPARGVDHGPAAEADAHVCDPSFAATLAEEKQVTHFERRLDRPSHSMLHIGVARDLHAGPAVQQTREGIYPASQAELFSDNYRLSGGKRRLADYYSSAYGRIAVHDKLKRNVVFFQHDLVSDYALGEMQVVFCRNVLIYFGESLRARVLGVFADSLCRGGFLCLGGSERVSASRSELFSDFDVAERIYRRRGAP